MPAVRILVDEVVVATVSTAGMKLIDVRLTSRRTMAPRACLDVGGATVAPITMLTFGAGRDLAPGQRVTIALVADGETEPVGKTFAELFPDAPKSEPLQRPDPAWARQQYAALPVHHQRYTIDVVTSLGTTVRGATADGIESLALSVDWHADDGDRADIRLSTTTTWPTLEDIGDSYLLREKMALGGSVVLTVG